MSIKVLDLTANENASMKIQDYLDELQTKNDLVSNSTNYAVKQEFNRRFYKIKNWLPYRFFMSEQAHGNEFCIIFKKYERYAVLNLNDSLVDPSRTITFAKDKHDLKNIFLHSFFIFDGIQPFTGDKIHERFNFYKLIDEFPETVLE